jgi:hypothetical protein
VSVSTDELTENWQSSIATKAESLLARKLTKKELAFIQNQKAFLALEAIEDRIEELSKEELKTLLNSKNEF